jgi:uncharacterized protein YndB with AHSA1/START domain
VSVQSDATGRRFVPTEFEVPGTPQEVWQAIATGPGISSWFMPAEMEERDGRPVALTLRFRADAAPRFAITAWNPPHSFTAQGESWGGAPPLATEWTVEARAGGTCVVRVVQSLFASTSEWDDQLQGAAESWAGFFRTLLVYMTHFRGQRSEVMQFINPVPGTEGEAWDALTTALGVKGLRQGEAWTAPAGIPAAGGVVEYFSETPYDALVRLNEPHPGVAALGAYEMNGQSYAGINLYMYGDHAAEAAAREAPQWRAWLEERFPTPAEPGNG